MRKKILHVLRLVSLGWLFGFQRAKADFILQGCPAEIERQLTTLCGASPYSDEGQTLAMLRRLLRCEGYYHPQIEPLARSFCGLEVLQVEIGQPTQVETIELVCLPNSAPPSLHQFYQENLLPAIGQRLSHRRYEALKKRLMDELKADGFRKARWVETRLEIDEVHHAAHWVWRLDCGPRFYVERVDYLTGEAIPKAWLQDLEPFQKGEPFTELCHLRLYEALMETGWFQSLWIYPQPPEEASGGSVVRCLGFPAAKFKWNLSGAFTFLSETVASLKAEVVAPWINKWGHQLHARGNVDWDSKGEALGSSRWWPSAFDGFAAYKLPRGLLGARPYALEVQGHWRYGSKGFYASTPPLGMCQILEDVKTFQLSASGRSYRSALRPLKWRVGVLYEQPVTSLGGLASSKSSKLAQKKYHYALGFGAFEWLSQGGAPMHVQCSLGGGWKQGASLEYGALAKLGCLLGTPSIRWGRHSWTARFFGQKLWSYRLNGAMESFPSSKYRCCSGGGLELIGYPEGEAGPVDWGSGNYGAENLWGIGGEWRIALLSPWQAILFLDGCGFDAISLKRPWCSWLVSLGAGVGVDTDLMKVSCILFYHLPHHAVWSQDWLRKLPGIELKIGK